MIMLAYPVLGLTMGIIIARPQTEYTTSTGSFAQALLRKVEIFPIILVLTVTRAPN